MRRALGRVALVGFRGGVDVGASLSAVRLPPRAIFSRSFEGFRAVVLGPIALRELDPVAAWPVLAPVRSRLVFCAETSTPHVVVGPWVRCGFGEPTPIEDLTERLASLERRQVRPWLAFEEWLPRMPVPGSHAATAASAVFHLPKLRAGALAAHLGWSRQTLGRVCKDGLGVTPKQLLLRYLGAAYRTMRA